MLMYAKRRGTIIATRTPGVSGKIVEIRQNDVVLTLTGSRSELTKHQYGTAYIHIDALSPPPSMFPVGSRVVTPFGRGVVLETRQTEERVDYKVELVERKMTGGVYPYGFFSPECVSLRRPHDRSFEEIIADADEKRNQGNEYFREKKWEESIAEYKKSEDILASVQYVGRALDHNEKQLLVKTFVLAASNAAQAHINIGTDESLANAVNACSQGLELRPAAAQEEKLLYRRGLAYLQLQRFSEAIKDFSHPRLANYENARRKLAEAREGLRKDKEQRQAIWANAFAKNKDRAGKDDVHADAAEPTDAAPGTARPSAASDTAKAVTADMDPQETEELVEEKPEEQTKSKMNWWAIAGAALAIGATAYTVARRFR